MISVPVEDLANEDDRDYCDEVIESIDSIVLYFNEINSGLEINLYDPQASEERYFEYYLDETHATCIFHRMRPVSGNVNN